MEFDIEPIGPKDFSTEPVYQGFKHICVFVVTKGTLVIDIAFEQRDVGVGKTFFIGPKMIFAAWPKNTNLEGYKIIIQANLWKKISKKNYDFMLFPSASIVKELVSYPHKDNQFDKFAIPLLIKIFENQMRDRCFPKDKSFMPLSFLIKPTTDARIIKACKIITEQYNEEEISINAIATQIAVTPRSMQRLFLNELGITPLDALKKIRIENALYLIASTDFSLTQIAQDVGYQSYTQFVSAFKSLMGMSPSSMKRKS